MSKDKPVYPDSYLSQDLPINERRKEFFRMVYGEDMETQPLCKCGRPRYYDFNRKTGKIELEEECELCRKLRNE